MPQTHLNGFRWHLILNDFLNNYYDNEYGIMAIMKRNFDPWSKVLPVLAAVHETFKAYFLPHWCISIDERMEETKDCVTYIQYMPNKHQCMFAVKRLCDTR